MMTPPINLRSLFALTLVTLALAAGAVACKRGGDAPSNGAAAADTADTAVDREQPPVREESLTGGVEPGSVRPVFEGPAAPTVMFLAGLKGYTEPCGCTADVLLGGIDRITQYVLDVRAMMPAAVMVDAGDLLFEHAELEAHIVPQERAKADVLVAAHRTMGTAFTVPGERDFAMGTAFYREKMAEAGVALVAANLTIDGASLPATHVVRLAGKPGKPGEAAETTVGFVGAVDPAHFEGVEGVEAAPAEEAVGRALAELEAERPDAVVLVFHGELGPAKALLERFEGIDFVVVGHGPRETDQVDAVNAGHTLEAYDQGRYLGVLRLYDNDDARPYVNASGASKTELETIERQISHVQESIARIPPADDGSKPPLVARLEERLAELEARKAEMAGASVAIPDDRRAFLYRPVAMEPGYGLHAELQELREAFNRSLQELNSQIEREVVPVAEGQPFFIGTAECAVCHAAAHEMWQGTHHSKAVATLEARDKAFDQSCIGCHVVGWEQPGGSVLGKLEYAAKIGDYEFTKDLRNVGCESCHGPGSAHRQMPVGADGQAQHILRQPTEQQCVQCHVAEHSPRFDFETYVKRITGPGHERRSVQ